MTRREKRIRFAVPMRGGEGVEADGMGFGVDGSGGTGGAVLGRGVRGCEGAADGVAGREGAGGVGADPFAAGGLGGSGVFIQRPEVEAGSCDQSSRSPRVPPVLPLLPSPEGSWEQACSAGKGFLFVMGGNRNLTQSTGDAEERPERREIVTRGTKPNAEKEKAASAKIRARTGGDALWGCFGMRVS